MAYIYTVLILYAYAFRKISTGPRLKRGMYSYSQTILKVLKKTNKEKKRPSFFLSLRCSLFLSLCSLRCGRFLSLSTLPLINKVALLINGEIERERNRPRHKERREQRKKRKKEGLFFSFFFFFFFKFQYCMVATVRSPFQKVGQRKNAYVCV